MQRTHETPADQLIRRLAEMGPLRVWSVVITAFGDYARAPSDRLSAARLRALTGRMGIRSDALRVAVHRLKRDGWLTASRSGRSSRYRLTARAFAECQAARPRIYAEAPAQGGTPMLMVCRDGTPPPPDSGFVQIAPRVFMGCARGPAGPAGPEEALCLAADGAAMPGWVRAGLAPAHVAEGYRHLAGLLQELLALGAPEDDDTREALRVLVIHRWRQLLLHHPDLPAAFFPTGWPGEECRALVQRALRLLPELRREGEAPPAGA